MSAKKLETTTLAAFDERLDTSNARLRQELAAAQTRVQQLEALIARKADFSQRLTEVLTEIEREENEIASLEEGLRSVRITARRALPAAQTLP